jgi:hypothetical protein
VRSFNATPGVEHRATALKLLRNHCKGRYASWIKRVRTIQRISRRCRTTLRELEREVYYDSPPLPCLLVAFKENDAIIACFDEESRYMLEGTREPMVGLIFSPNDQDEVRQLVRILSRFFALHIELFRLAEELQELC